MIFKALSAKAGETFARELAGELMAQLGSAADHGTKKFQARSGKALQQAERRIEAFTREQPLNWLQRAKTGNAFLWALKDAGCPEAYAQELTQWLVAKL